MPVLSGVASNILVTRAYRQLKLGVHDDGFSTHGALPTTVQFAPPAVSAGTTASRQADAPVVEVRNVEH